MSGTDKSTGWVRHYERNGQRFVAYCRSCSDRDPAIVSEDGEGDWMFQLESGDVWIFKRGNVTGVLALLQGGTMGGALLMSSRSSMRCSRLFWAGNEPHAVCHLARHERPGVS